MTTIEPRSHRPFIPAWLDDAGLPAQDHRVLTHLWRRAGKKGTCWPAAPSIARVCRLKVSTVWTCIARLEKAGLLARRKHFRNANEYRLTIPSIDPNGAPIQQIESVPQTDCQSTPLGHHPIDPNGAPPSAEREMPPKKGVCEGTLTHSWPLAIPDEEAERIAEAQRMTPDAVRVAYAAYRKRKLAYQDKPPANESDVWAGLEGWVETQKPKRNNRAFERTQRDKFDEAVITFRPEPAPGWRERIINAEPDLDWLSSGATPEWVRALVWVTTDAEYQRRIANREEGIANGKH